ncbi:MAG: DUF1062 domain-containing protein [Lachnospiraceae bacterium]|nr:DUF1062 domain-containing protein [Lachnospiraceae bacterium]
MSYVNIMEYEVIPTETFKIIRGCAGCGCKQIFSSKANFRVNANGNHLDVWLIYGCEKCGHTYNLPVYERINPTKIAEKEYRSFLSNDKDMVFKVGTDKTIFARNKAEIARKEIRYQIVPLKECKAALESNNIMIKLYNSYDIPIRADKLVAEILKVTRNEAKKLLAEGMVSVCIENKAK